METGSQIQNTFFNIEVIGLDGFDVRFGEKMSQENHRLGIGVTE